MQQINSVQTTLAMQLATQLDKIQSQFFESQQQTVVEYSRGQRKTAHQFG